LKTCSILFFGLAALVAGALGACATEGGNSGFIENSAAPDAGPPPPNGSFSEAGAGDPDPSILQDCAEETKQIYVLATDKSLYRFYPDKLEFLRIGTLGCATAAGTFSMAIDRKGIAWVEFTDGSVFSVDTTNANCKPTTFVSGQKGFETFGMGFAKNEGEEKGETLYVAGDGLAALDTKTFQLSFKGSLTYGRTELTGLDTELYAYSIESGVIAALDKTNGGTKKTYRTSAIDPFGGFAFAQWGGDFWVFTGQTTSRVTRYTPTTDESLVVVPDTGMLIVGAGSSTCAPTKRPN
jgi:hypothetical protein